MTCKKRIGPEGLPFSLARYRSHEGFSLIELLVTIVLSSIVMAAIYSVYRVQTRTLKVQENRMLAQEYGRSVLDLMVRETRNVGYFPVGACTTDPVNINGIISASSQSFQFVYDANGQNGCDDPDENITYAFNVTGCSSGLGNITREDAANPGAVALTNCNVATGTANFSFTYFAKDSTTPMSPIILANIKRVTISLIVQSKDTGTEFGGGQLKATMTSTVDLRNRGLPS